MSTTMSNAAKAEFLKGLGLNPDAASLAEPVVVAEVEPKAKAKKAKKKAKKAKPEVAAVDTHTMALTDIVFTSDMVKDFDLTVGAQFRAASQVLFDRYKGPKGDARNRLLHRLISEFLASERMAKRTKGAVSKRVEVSQEVGDLAQLLQQKGITAADLMDLINSK